MSVIILNGASSSGKSSIARAIQMISRTPFLHISVDTFVDMFRWESIYSDELRRECHQVGISNFHRALPPLLSHRFPAVIDHVFEKDEWYRDCISSLNDHRIFLVGVTCPLEVLRARERSRGDRRVGLAEYQSTRVHTNRAYDFQVDTSSSTSEECATSILREFTVD